MLSGILRPCFLSSILFYESRAPTITVRGVELLPGMFQVGDLRTASGFFGLLSAILNAPKCPGIADQSEVLFDDANGYLHIMELDYHITFEYFRISLLPRSLCVYLIAH